jgi:hypothetical protein
MNSLLLLGANRREINLNICYLLFVFFPLLRNVPSDLLPSNGGSTVDCLTSEMCSSNRRLATVIFVTIINLRRVMSCTRIYHAGSHNCKVTAYRICTVFMDIVTTFHFSRLQTESIQQRDDLLSNCISWRYNYKFELKCTTLWCDAA